MPRKTRILPPEGLVPNRGVNELLQESSLDPAEWLEGLDVEPVPSGVRRRRGIVHAGEVPGGAAVSQLLWEGGVVIPVCQFSRYDYVPELITKWAQSFTTASTAGLRAFDWKNHVLAGTWDAVRVKFSLHAPGATPGAVVAGYEQDKFNDLAGSGFRRIFGGEDPYDFTDTPWSSFVFAGSSPPALTSGLVYWCVLEVTMPGNPSGLLNQSQSWSGCKTGTGPYAGGECIRYKDGAWEAGTSSDATFSISLDNTAKVITAIYDYQRADGTKYHLLVYDDGSIYYQSAGVLTSVGTLPSAHGDDVLPSLATAQDVCYLTNNETGDPSKKIYYDGVSVQFKNEGIAAPTGVMPLYTPAAAGGSLPDDVYYIDWYYWDSLLKVQSETRWQGDIRNCPAVTVAAGGGSGKITIDSGGAGIPGLVRANDSADKIRFNIFPKTTDIGKWRYSGLEVDVAAAGPHVIDDPDDFLQEASFDHDLPPVHGIKAATSERQFIADIEDDENAVRWTRIDGIDIDIESYPAANRREIGILEGGKVTALFLVPPNTLLIGKRNSIWAMNSERPHQTEELLVAKGVGISGHRAGVVVGRSLYFISAADKVKGPMVWNGASVQPLLNLDRTFKALNKARLHLGSCGHLAKDEARFQWWTLLPRAGQTQNDRILVYDYNLDAWTVYRIKGSVLNQAVESNDDEIFIGGYDSRERKADTGGSDLGEEIVGELTLPAYTFGDMHATKKLRGMQYIINQLAAGSIALNVEVDYGAKTPVNRTIDLAGRVGDVLGTDTLPFLLGGGGNQIKDVKFRASGRVFKPKLTSSSDWIMQRIAWMVQEVDRK